MRGIPSLPDHGRLSRVFSVPSAANALDGMPEGKNKRQSINQVTGISLERHDTAHQPHRLGDLVHVVIHAGHVMPDLVHGYGHDMHGFVDVRHGG